MAEHEFDPLEGVGTPFPQELEEEEESPLIQGEVLEDTSKFQFDFDKYQQQQSKDTHLSGGSSLSNNKGIRAFSMVLMGVLAAASVYFGVIGLAKLFTGEKKEPQGDHLFAPGALVVEDGPSTGQENLGIGATVSVRQSLSKVKSAMVGIQLGGETGSGVLIDANGLLVTSARLLGGVGEVQVTLLNGEVHTAQKIGEDEKTDIALLRIDASHLALPEFAQVGELPPGEQVYFVGYNGRTKEGVASVKAMVSASDYLVQNYGAYSIYAMQADRVVPDFYTGGAVINGRGQVVGMYSAYLSQTQSDSGALYLSMANVRQVSRALQEGKAPKGRVRLGLVLGETGQMFSAQNKGVQGLLVTEIARDSGLFLKGVREGDVITKVNGRSVRRLADLEQEFEGFTQGDSATFQLVRTRGFGSAQPFEVSAVLTEE